MSDKHFEQAAYHESGHIVMAYMAEFACTDVSLNSATPGEAWTRMDYGEDRMLATAILVSGTNPEIFNQLTKDVKAPSPKVAQRLCYMICGGPLAEAWHKHGVDFKGDFEVEMQGPDREMVEAIDTFLSAILGDRHPVGYLDQTLKQLAGLMRSEKLWSTVTKMADALQAAPNRTMNGAEIEAVLQDCGYLTFLEEQRAKQS